MNRRDLLVGAGGIGAGAAAVGGAAYALLPTCPYDPAALAIDNETDEPVSAAVEIRSGGGTIYDERVDVADFYRELPEAVPIGCSFPTDVTVHVATGSHGETTQTITFGRPDPPHGTLSKEAEVRIYVREEGLAVEANFWFAVR